MKNFIYLLLALLVISCEDTEDVITETSNDLLIGTWTYSTSDTEQITFVKSATLPENERGIQFKENGVFIERSAGWCATPPLVYLDEQGSWVLNDSTLDITLKAYPGGYNWDIISLSNNELVVKRYITEQEKENLELMVLFNEIYDLSISVTCENTSEWAYIAYGAKACGGPQGFIPYSTNIDVDAFLEKVEAYTKAEDAFNKKWGVISTCDVPAQPTGVECHPNGYAVLIYGMACNRVPVIDKDLYDSSDSDTFKLSHVEIVDDCLFMDIEADGCSGLSWELTLVDSGDIAESAPEQRFLKLQFTNNEPCLAEVNKTFSFNIKSLQLDNPESAVLFNIQGVDDKLEYIY